MSEASINRAVALIDGMNIFNLAKRAFGYHYPNYDPAKLAKVICAQQRLTLVETRFYTGVPSRTIDSPRYYFWENKTHAMEADGVHVYTRTIRYSGPRPQEKGIDIRIALDAVMLALENIYDTLIIFSTDQDFTELKPAIISIAKQQDRLIRLKCAYPSSQQHKIRGIKGMDWIPIDKTTYDASVDPRDYRSRRYT